MKAYMSFLNLYMNNANFEVDGKLATLWFDKLLLGADESLLKKTIEHVAKKERWSNDTLNEVEKIQISAESILPGVNFLDESMIEDNKYDMALQIMKNNYEKELANPETYGGAMHEVIMGSAGIAGSVKYWTLLNAKSGCTFMPTSLEQQMLKRLFSSTTDIEFNNFSNIITSLIPDISSYSWDKIIEIRHHHYWTSFRNKLTELSKAYTDRKLSYEILNEIVNKDIIEMAQHLRPRIKKNIVKSVICNIPLPIPVNPVSIVCSGYDIFKEIDFNKKYGWIYFYLDNKK